MLHNLRSPSRLALAVTGLFFALSFTSSARAVTIPATDYDGVSGIGSLVDTATATMLGPGSADFGELTTNVYFDGTGTYTYENVLTPAVDNISEFVTAFPVIGFTGVAGWSFSEAAAAGGVGTSDDFLIFLDLDSTIDWETGGPGFAADPFDSGETVTFFFQSTAAPRPGAYSQIDGGAANAQTLGTTVPEASTLLLLGSALLALGWIRWR